MNLRHGAPARAICCRTRGPLGPRRRRADAVARRAAGLDARAWLRGRCRQPHVSHGDSGALAARARGGRPARRSQRVSPAGHASFSTARRARCVDRAGRPKRSKPPNAPRRGRAAVAAITAAREPLTTADGVPHPPGREPGAAGGPAVPAGSRRRWHRPVPLGVPAVGSAARGGDRRRAVRGVIAAARAGGPAAGDHPHVRPRRASSRTGPAADARAAGAGASRPAARPRAPGGPPHPAARAAARLGARLAARHVPVRHLGRGVAPGARGVRRHRAWNWAPLRCRWAP